MSNENSHHETALQANPRKKQYTLFQYYHYLLANYSPSCRSDPLVGHGRHFGRTVHAWCSMDVSPHFTFHPFNHPHQVPSQLRTTPTFVTKPQKLEICGNLSSLSF